MAKARPLGSPARKAGGKETKAQAGATAARKTVAARVAAPSEARAVVVAAKPGKSGALRQAVATAPAVIPPPLPAPIASFTF